MFKEIFQADRLPAFQNKTFATRNEAIASPAGALRLVQDEATGLMFNAAFDPSLMKYDQDYQNEQALSSAFKRHLDDVTSIILRHFEGAELIEVGCGKGYFLKHLLERGVRVTGIDPAYEGDNPAVIKALFSPELGLRADGIVLRHVLEHVQDPAAFLGKIAEANGWRGLIYIEVPCMDWIADHHAWFDLFYEHVNYFRLEDFNRLFGRVIESGRIFGGQYLYVVADLATLRTPIADASSAFGLPDGFFAGIEDLARAGRSGGKAAIWGASSKGVIFALHMARAGNDIDFAIDINPAKQGRFLPGTGLPVHSAETAFGLLESDDVIFVMNSNYFDEISALCGGRFQLKAVDKDVL